MAMRSTSGVMCAKYKYRETENAGKRRISKTKLDSVRLIQVRAQEDLVSIIYRSESNSKKTSI
jgi:hypothetical protein